MSVCTKDILDDIAVQLMAVMFSASVHCILHKFVRDKICVWSKELINGLFSLKEMSLLLPTTRRKLLCIDELCSNVLLSAICMLPHYCNHDRFSEFLLNLGDRSQLEEL